jgi:hypothetical protein
MRTTDDIHDALALWHADDTQWLLTDDLIYAICREKDARRLLGTTHQTRWRLTSPEELARTIEA